MYGWWSCPLCSEAACQSQCPRYPTLCGRVGVRLTGRQKGGGAPGWLSEPLLPGQSEANCPFGKGGCSSFFFFLRLHLFNFLEKGEERETERDRNINIWLPL